MATAICIHDAGDNHAQVIIRKLVKVEKSQIAKTAHFVGAKTGRQDVADEIIWQCRI